MPLEELRVLFPSVSQETQEKIHIYQNLLEKWQKTINLVSPSTIPQAERRHFIDSLQILPHIPPDARLVYDMGSGAGFPGLVLAIARPDLQTHLIESDQRKGSFLATVSRETKTPVTIHTARIESLDLPAPDVITARALASLTELLGYTKKWWVGSERPPCHVFLKGAQADEEILEARKTYSFEISTAPSLTDPQGKVLVLTGIR